MESWEVTLNIGDKISGKELLTLLQKIDETGSISKAVEKVGVSYRHGWGVLKKAEETLGQSLVSRQTGGTTGGGTKLTPEGIKLLGHMHSLQREVQGQLVSLFDEKEPEQANYLLLASTAEPIATGLLDVLEQTFLNETGIRVRHVSVGSGQALNMAKAGRVDVVLTHAPKLEDNFVREGWGVFKLFVMCNAFVVIGPRDDPAHIAKSQTVVEAFQRIAKCESFFISRGDRSGTHLHEAMLWEKAGIEPKNFHWYLKSQNLLDNYSVIQKSSEVGAYTLVDQASYVTGSMRKDLEVLYKGDLLLNNEFSVIPVSRKKAAVNQQDSEKFARWLLSETSKKIIENFGKQEFGFNLFTPSHLMN